MVRSGPTRSARASPSATRGRAASERDRRTSSATPSAPRRRVAERVAAEELVGGYTSAPPPGAFGGNARAAPDAFGGFAASIGTPAGRGTYRLAGWWSRVGAALLDGLIIGVGGLLLLVVVGAVFSVGFFASDTAGVISVIVGLMLSLSAFAVIALLYAPFMMARTNGQTLGKMALGIRVIRTNDEPMSFGWAMLREVAVKWLLFGVVGGSTTFGLAAIADVLWPLWDEENRALHDFIVSTRVIKD